MTCDTRELVISMDAHFRTTAFRTSALSELVGAYLCAVAIYTYFSTSVVFAHFGTTTYRTTGFYFLMWTDASTFALDTTTTAFVVGAY